MRKERLEWFKSQNVKDDVICRKNCLDVCVQHNNTVLKNNTHVKKYLEREK
jgi:hypothetical protein